MNTTPLQFTPDERRLALTLYSQLRQKIASSLLEDDEARMRQHIRNSIAAGLVHRDVFGLNPIVHSLQTALLVVDEIGLRRDAVLAILLCNPLFARLIPLHVLQQHRWLNIV